MLIYSGNSDFGDKAIIRQNGIPTQQNVILLFLEASYCCLCLLSLLNVIFHGNSVL